MRAAADTRPSPTDPRPPAADGSAAEGPASGADEWRRYFQETGIRVETEVPARELTPRQARAAGARMVPALAALSAPPERTSRRRSRWTVAGGRWCSSPSG